MRRLINNWINKVLFKNRAALGIQLMPALLIMIGLFIIPVVLLFVVSLWKFIPGGILTASSPTLENYSRNLTHPHYQEVIFRTLKQGFLTATYCLLLGFPFASILARTKSKITGLLLFVLFVPLFVSVVVRNFGWIVIMDRKGLINYALQAIGFISKPLKILDTMTGVLIGLVNVLLAFMVMPIYSVLVNIPKTYEEAAKTLGANPLMTWLRITIPLSLPGIVAGWVMVFSLSISSYVSPSVLGGPAYFVMSTVLYQQVNGALNWPFAASTGFLLLIIGLISLYLPVSILKKLTWLEEVSKNE